MTQGHMMTNAFGRSGRNVSIVGLGGEGILRTHGQELAAREVIQTAISEGITYFDSARAYAGSEEYYGLVWPKQPKDRARVFQTSKSAMRTKKEALLDIEKTLKNMGIEALDLWQIHDVRSEEEFGVISGPGGALEAFIQAKKEGKTRFIGATAHHDPSVLTRIVKEWPIDSVLLPVNPVEAVITGFLDQTLSAAIEKQIAVIGMKVLGASHYLSPQDGISAEHLVRFALSYPISAVIVGCSTPQEVQTLARVGRTFEPMGEAELKKIIELYRPHAVRLAYYRGVV